jgi:hypothetical protein
MVKADRIDLRHCINCAAANRLRSETDSKRATSHASTDIKCPFWKHRFDRDWLKRQFKKSD